MKVTKTILLLLAVVNADDVQEEAVVENSEPAEGENNQEEVDAENQEPAEADNNEEASENPDPSGADNEESDPATGDQSESNTDNQDSNQNNDSDETENQDNSGEENQESQESEAQDEVEANDDSQPNEEQTLCQAECGADEVCATLTSVIDIEGNTLPENHPNFGAQQNKCTAKDKCGTNFEDDNGDFFSAECPQTEEPQAESGEQNPDSNDESESAPESEDPLLLPEDENQEEVPIDAIDIRNEEDSINDALEAEAAAIALTQNQIGLGESGGSCGLGDPSGDQKCNYVEICCGVGENALGGRLENICGNGRGPNEPMNINGIEYNHVCGSMKLLASLGSIAAALYMM